MWLRIKPTLSKLLQDYLAIARLSVNTVKLTERAFGQMLDFAGDMRVDRLTVDTIEQLQAWWFQRVNATSCRMYHKAVSPVFSWAVQKKYIKANPFRKVKLAKPTKRQVRVYQPFEFRRMLQACGDDLRWIAILLIARTTGMRKSAIQNLTRSDICFETEVITVGVKAETDSTWYWRPKDREERKVPLVPQVLRFLTELIYQIPNTQPYILLKPSRYYHLLEVKKSGLMPDEARLYPISNFDRKFGKIKKKAGVKGRFHDLRATCLTDLASVLNPNELMSISGHSDIDTAMRYIGTGHDTVIKARKQVIASLGDLIAPSHAL